MGMGNAEAEEHTNRSPRRESEKGFDLRELDACTPERVMLRLATR